MELEEESAHGLNGEESLAWGCQLAGATLAETVQPGCYPVQPRLEGLDLVSSWHPEPGHRPSDAFLNPLLQRQPLAR